MMTRSVRAVALELDPALRPASFVRNGLVWNQYLDSRVNVIELQKHSASPEIAVNYGVFLTDAFTLVWPEVELPKQKQQPQCVIRRRASDAAGRELWIDIRRENCGDEVRAVLNGEVLPFFASISNASTILSGIEGNRPHLPQDAAFRASLLRDLGHFDQGCAQLREAAMTAGRRSSHWMKRLEDVAKRLECSDR